MTECPRCNAQVSHSECTSCGLRITLDTAGSSDHLIRRYFRTLLDIHLRPTEFFQKLRSNPDFKSGIGKTLAFAMVTHWLGAALSHLWQVMLGGGIKNLLNPFLSHFQHWTVDHPGRNVQWLEAKEALAGWFSGVGGVILDPFWTLFNIMILSLFVFAGARILVPAGNIHRSQEVTFESAVKIVALGMTPSILSGIPLVGAVIAAIAVFVVTIIAARETYQIETGRSILIVLFPKLIFLGIMMMGLFFLMFIIFSLLI